VGVLIDASILIARERGTVDLDARLPGREREPAFISVVTASELLHGVHRATDDAVRNRRAAFVEALLAQFPMLSIDLPVARAHARLWADLARAGTPVGAHDLWLAATCQAHGLSIATTNVREFRRVPGLVVEDWTTRD
jgi:predicted nucleic acid-binding protein